MKKNAKRENYLKELYSTIPCNYKKNDVEKKEFMVKSSDGVRLRTVYWYPKKSKSLSLIVTRSCYPNQEYEFEIHGEECAMRGFGFVVQWCRGINGSEGEWEPNIYERSDGLELMNFLSGMENVKNIGYWGNSYLASTGWCIADAVPDKVKSMYLGVYGTDRYTSVYQDGLFRQDIFTWWTMDNAGVPITADYVESCKYRPQIDVDEKLWNTHLGWYRQWISNTDRDSEYWSKEGFWKMMSEIPSKVNIPVYIREGWYDHHLGSAIVSWNKLFDISKENSVLQIGPWRHEYDYVLEGQNTENIGDDSVSSVLEWFEKTLKNEMPPKRYCELYMIGADKWVSFYDLPQNTLKNTRLYMNASGEKKDKKVLSLEPKEKGEISYQYNPENPVSSHGAESCFKSIKQIGSLFQPECGYREDVISFVSDPIQNPIQIMGNIEIILYVSSDAEDTSFTAKVMEIFPDGKTVNIRGSITTLAYRNGAIKRCKYNPGEKVKISIKMWPIAWETKPGSRIRVDVSSSDFPQYSVHTNYPGIWAFQKNVKSSKQTIYYGKEQESCVIIPVMNNDRNYKQNSGVDYK